MTNLILPVLAFVCAVMFLILLYLEFFGKDYDPYEDDLINEDQDTCNMYEQTGPCDIPEEEFVHKNAPATKVSCCSSRSSRKDLSPCGNSSYTCSKGS